ncbi:WD repeat-containing protein 43-like [Anneissia japonica]|uniref:WD repeat-containing protein 43-like n=1 Tax=Anneissia japonica TaxID=1529436 RepID=UPI001425639D|nr:WD repeat-containing protein 43-like [Anneissia japonica]
MASKTCILSPNGGCLAVSSPDGRLTIWDTITGIPRQQYTPSSHLSATCTCISWSAIKHDVEDGPKRKRRKSEKRSNEKDIEIIAMGTSSGSILLYSVLKGDLLSKLDGGHDDTVNDLCWHPKDNTLFSCSDDQHIVQWNVRDGKVKCKWKADKSSVNSMCISPCGKIIISAGRTIQVWDLETKEVLKKFTGHASSVSSLKMVSLNNTTNDDDDTSVLESVDGCYFMSMAVGDRIINVWQIKAASKNKSSIVQFTLPDEPTQLTISNKLDSEPHIFVSVVTKSGQVHIFDPVLNGRSKKPLSHRSTVQVATQGSQNEMPKPIPIMCSRFYNDSDQRMLVVHGSFMKPVFENIVFSAETDVCLIRDDPSLTQLNQGDKVADKVRQPLTSQDVTVLAPGNMAPARPSQETDGFKKDNNKRKSLRTELSLAERLNTMEIAQAIPQTSKTQQPKTESLAVLLTQGLQSRDKDILRRVFRYNKEYLIRNTVRRLPVPLIIPLLQELAVRLNTNPENGQNCVVWTKIVLKMHTSYLMTCPDLVQLLSNLYEMINSRTTMGNRLSKLHGKLDLMLSQIMEQNEEKEDDDFTQASALLVYEESSDEMENVIEDGLQSRSDSEGDWEDLEDSDMEVNQNEVESDGDGDRGGGENDEAEDESDDGGTSSEEEDEEEVAGSDMSD